MHKPALSLALSLSLSLSLSHVYTHAHTYERAHFFRERTTKHLSFGVITINLEINQLEVGDGLVHIRPSGGMQNKGDGERARGGESEVVSEVVREGGS